MGFNKGLIISIILVSVVFLSASGLLLSVGYNYGVSVGPAFNDTFNKYAESEELVYNMEETVTGGEINPEGQDQAVYKQVIIAGKTARSSAELAEDLVSNSARYIPTQAIIIGLVITLIFTLTTFGFIAMITRRNP